jgi:uncharacterized membrane protein
MDPRSIVEWGGAAFELLGVAILAIGSVYFLGRFAIHLTKRPPGVKAYRALREGLGRTLMLGLEVLVAADIVRSVALEPSFESVGVLGLIVLVRTFLSWSLEVEIAGEWPWRRASHNPVNEDSGV